MGDDRNGSVGFTTEIYKDLKRIIMTLVWALIIEPIVLIAGFLLYLNNYDVVSHIEQNGLYTFSDSDGNVISSDITPEEMKEILNIINNGKD